MHELPPFSITLAGTQNAVRDGLAQAMMLLAPLQLGTDESGTVELVLAEALNNVLEHALSRATKQTKIEICGHHDMSGLHLTVIDCGAPMPDGTAPIKKAPNLDVNTDDMPKEGLVGI